ncbi:2681_t:CDS:2, partial [Cetraspora pellucida]
MLPHPHTGEEIDTYLRSIFAAFKITDKILCATTDSSSNMILAMQLLKSNLVLYNQLFHFQSHRCSAHILNLIIISGLLSIKSSIEKDLKKLGQSVEEGKTTHKILQDVSTRWNSTYLMLS